MREAESSVAARANPAPAFRVSNATLARYLAVSLAVIVADQLTKAVVQNLLGSGGDITVTPFFSIVLAYNTGAAFSFLATAAGWQRWLFAGIAAVAAVVIVWLLRRGGSRMFSLALALILGGALGNLYDRLTLGKVVDFLLFHYEQWAYPAFNVADSAITIGAALLIIDSFRTKHAHA